MDYISMEQQLDESYREVFVKAHLYACCRNISLDASDEMLMDLFDILMEANKHNKSVDKIVGNDIEKFCKDFFSSYDLKERLKDIPRIIFRFMLGLLILEGIFLIADKENIRTYRTDVFPYLTGILAGFFSSTFCDIVLKPVIFRSKKIKAVIYYVIIVCVFVAFLFLGVYLSGLLSINIGVWPIFIVSVVYVVGYSLVNAVIRYRRNGTVFKKKINFQLVTKDSKEVSFERALEAEIKKQLFNRYKRMNRRRIRHKKPEMTSGEFVEVIRKEIAKMSNMWKIMLIVYGLIVAGPVITELITNGILNSLILLAVLLVIEVPIYRYCKKADCKAVECRRKILDDCEEKGIDLIDYIGVKEAAAS